MRPSYTSNLKSFVLVEFSTVDEAISCRRSFNLDDGKNLKKLKLGDRRLEVNILIGSKVMRPFEAITASLMQNSTYGQNSYSMMN